MLSEAFKGKISLAMFCFQLFFCLKAFLRYAIEDFISNFTLVVHLHKPYKIIIHFKEEKKYKQEVKQALDATLQIVQELMN